MRIWITMLGLSLASAVAMAGSQTGAPPNVPEPSLWALLAVGGVGFLLSRKRK